MCHARDSLPTASDLALPVLASAFQFAARDLRPSVLTATVFTYTLHPPVNLPAKTRLSVDIANTTLKAQHE
ncbi:hypothetical protein BDR22DRAFT_850946 [Usnea florida]